MVFNNNDSAEFLGIPDEVDIEDFFQNYSLSTFNKKGYIRGDAKPQGTFLGHDYGAGMYLQNPADVLAFALIEAYRNELDDVPEEEALSVYAIKSRLKNMIDFHKSFPQKEFLKAVSKTFRGEFIDAEEFFFRLENNIVVKEVNQNTSYLLTKDLMSQVREVVKTDQTTDEKSLRKSFQAITSSPKGYPKTDLISKAYGAITENFSEDRWVRSLLNWLRAASADEEYFFEMLDDNDPYLQVLADGKAYSLQSAAQRGALQTLSEFIQLSSKATYEKFVNQENSVEEFGRIMQ